MFGPRNLDFFNVERVFECRIGWISKTQISRDPIILFQRPWSRVFQVQTSPQGASIALKSWIRKRNTLWNILHNSKTRLQVYNDTRIHSSAERCAVDLSKGKLSKKGTFWRGSYCRKNNDFFRQFGRSKKARKKKEQPLMWRRRKSY